MRMAVICAGRTAAIPHTARCAGVTQGPLARCRRRVIWSPVSAFEGRDSEADGGFPGDAEAEARDAEDIKRVTKGRLLRRAGLLGRDKAQLAKDVSKWWRQWPDGLNDSDKTFFNNVLADGDADLLDDHFDEGLRGRPDFETALDRDIASASQRQGISVPGPRATVMFDLGWTMRKMERWWTSKRANEDAKVCRAPQWGTVGERNDADAEAFVILPPCSSETARLHATVARVAYLLREETRGRANRAMVALARESLLDNDLRYCDPLACHTGPSTALWALGMLASVGGVIELLQVWSVTDRTVQPSVRSVRQQWALTLPTRAVEPSRHWRLLGTTSYLVDSSGKVSAIDVQWERILEKTIASVKLSRRRRLAAQQLEPIFSEETGGMWCEYGQNLRQENAQHCSKLQHEFVARLASILNTCIST